MDVNNNNNNNNTNTNTNIDPYGKLSNTMEQSSSDPYAAVAAVNDASMVDPNALFIRDSPAPTCLMMEYIGTHMADDGRVNFKFKVVKSLYIKGFDGDTFMGKVISIPMASLKRYLNMHLKAPSALSFLAINGICQTSGQGFGEAWVQKLMACSDGINEPGYVRFVLSSDGVSKFQVHGQNRRAFNCSILPVTDNEFKVSTVSQSHSSIRAISDGRDCIYVDEEPLILSQPQQQLHTTFASVGGENSSYIDGAHKPLLQDMFDHDLVNDKFSNLIWRNNRNLKAYMELGWYICVFVVNHHIVTGGDMVKRDRTVARPFVSNRVPAQVVNTLRVFYDAFTVDCLGGADTGESIEIPFDYLPLCNNYIGILVAALKASLCELINVDQ